MPTLAGPEIGVASTKAFTCQLAVMVALAIAAGRARGVRSENDEQRLAHAQGERARARAADRTTCPGLAQHHDALYLGGGASLPIAGREVTARVYAVPVQTPRHPYCRCHGHRRRSAAQSCQVGDGGIDDAVPAVTAPPYAERPDPATRHRRRRVAQATKCYASVTVRRPLN